MTQKQYDKHQTEKVNKKEKGTSVFLPILRGPMNFAFPGDNNWYLRKQQTHSWGSNKNHPAGPRPEWKKPAPPEPLPVAVQEFVDKHIKQVLEQTEEGREFLKENPDGPPVTA